MNKIIYNTGQSKLFILLMLLGWVAQFNHVHFPHTEILIDGRWVFGFMGFALLQRWWAALFLGILLSTPFGSDVPFVSGYLGNLLYAVPCFLVIRPVSRYLQARWGADWLYGLSWFFVVFFCYQAFVTPSVWAVTAALEGVPVWPTILEGWRTQPLLVESILVAAFSAVAMVAILSHQQLKKNQKRFDHINRVLLGIRNVNQLIVSEDNPQRLIEQACDNLTESMGYFNAWIVLVDGDSQKVSTASSGLDACFDTLRDQIERGDYPFCVAHALDCAETLIIEDPETQCLECPLSASYGGRAGLSRRMAYDGKIYGVLSASVPVDYADDAEENNLFEEVTDDLAFALYKIEKLRQFQIEHQRLDYVIEGSSLGTWEWNIQTGETVFNETWATMLGYTLEELMPYSIETWEERTHPEDLARAQEQIKLYLSGQTPDYECEQRIKHRDGHWVWILDRGRIMTRDAEGKPLSMFGTHTDISRLKQAAEALQVSEQQFRTLFMKSPVSIMVHDKDTGEILDANPAAYTSYGLTSVEALQASDFWLEPPYSFNEALENIRKTALEGPQQFEWLNRRVSGELFWESVYLTSINMNGVERVLSKSIDITARKQATEAQKENEIYLHTILQTAADGFWVIDCQGRVCEVNEAYCAMSGYARDEIIGMNIGDLDADEAPAETAARIQRIITNGSEIFETRHRRKDGSIFYVEVSSTFLPERGGQFICFCRDLTERKQSEERLALLGQMLDAAPAAITVHTTKGKFVFANRQTVRLHGYDREDDFLNVNLHELDVPESEALLAERFRRIEQEGEARFEVAHYRRDGSTFPLEVLAKIIEWNGKPAVLSVATDITERKQAEEALTHSYDLMHYIIEHANSAVAVHDRDLRYVYVSQRYLNAYGVKEKDIIGKHHYDVFPDLPQKWRAVHQKALAGEVSRSECDAYPREDGSLEWTRWECRPWYEASGVIGGFVVYTEVITERVRAEEAVRRFSRIFEDTLNEIFLFDCDTLRFTQVNNAALTNLGYNFDELKTMTPLDIKPELSQGEFLEILAPLRRGEKKKVVFETVHERKDHTRYPVEVHLQMLNLHHEHLFFAIILDITDRVNLETQLLQAQKMESVGRLAGGVAHDFNNMLSVILGHAELIMHDLPSDSPWLGDFQEIRKAAQRSADLTRQLLAFARKQTVAPKVLDLNETIESMLKMLRRLIGEDIDLLWKPGKSLAPVKIDPSQIDQILANLCINARDAIGHTNGKVTIETGMADIDEDYCASHNGFIPGRFVMLAFSDDGCGMDETVLSQIFEPFFTTKNVGEGTGLGLAMVYGIVKQNNGFINVYSELTKGTTFRIYLPCHSAEAALHSERPLPDIAPHGTETILLVEDEPSILQMTKKILERQDYTVLTAATPREALQLVESFAGEIHLLITDVVMPEMNGRDLAQHLLALYPNLKLLFMSGYTANVIAHHGVLDEGVFFVQKPFTTKQLGAKVREILDT